MKIVININIDRLTDSIIVNHPDDIQKCTDNIAESLLHILNKSQSAVQEPKPSQEISIQMRIETLERDRVQILDQLRLAVPRLTKPNHGKIVKSYSQELLKGVLSKVEELLIVETALEDYYRQ